MQQEFRKCKECEYYKYYDINNPSTDDDNWDYWIVDLYKAGFKRKCTIYNFYPPEDWCCGKQK